MNFLVSSKILYPNENGFMYEKKSFFYLLKLLFKTDYIYNLPIDNLINLCPFGKTYRMHTLLKWYLFGKPYYNIFLFNLDNDRNKYLIIYFTFSFSLKKWYNLFLDIEVYEVMYLGHISNIF